MADLGDEHFRIVITAPDKDMQLQEDDIAFMLVQYEEEDAAAGNSTKIE